MTFIASVEVSFSSGDGRPLAVSQAIPSPRPASWPTFWRREAGVAMRKAVLVTVATGVVVLLAAGAAYAYFF
ncbi:MAG: hypothetical protein M3024_15375, partial [Candidatus Dormibacteraeota bacterium]|nr:hypothetical protein [Candidatus Dormibacteraeota bacterium]